MQDLKDLKRCLHESTFAGDRPPRYGMQGRLGFTVGRGPVPRRASICPGNGFGRWTIFAQIERSRGTGPRATGPEEFSSPCAVREQALPNYSHRDTRAFAGETRSDARVASEGPRATGPEGFSSRSVGP